MKITGIDQTPLILNGLLSLEPVKGAGNLTGINIVSLFIARRSPIGGRKRDAQQGFFQKVIREGLFRGASHIIHAPEGMLPDPKGLLSCKAFFPKIGVIVEEVPLPVEQVMGPGTGRGNLFPFSRVGLPLCPQQLPDEVLSVEETEALIRSFLEKENGPLAHIEVQTSIRTSAYRDPMHFSYYPHGQMDSKECLETVASELFGDMAYDDETYGAQCGDWRLESGMIMEKGNHIGSYYRDNDTIVIEECSNAKALDVLSKQASAFFTVEEPDVPPKKNDIGFER